MVELWMLATVGTVSWFVLGMSQGIDVWDLRSYLIKNNLQLVCKADERVHTYRDVHMAERCTFLK